MVRCLKIRDSRGPGIGMRFYRCPMDAHPEQTDGSEVAGLDEDSRGVLDPATLQRFVTLDRFSPGAALDGLIDWFWAVRWDLPVDQRFASKVLSQPGVNISVGNGAPEGVAPPPGPYPVCARVVGVTRAVQTRVLTGVGWNVAAKTTTGGFGAFISGSVADLTERERPIGAVLSVDAADLEQRMAGAAGPPARAEILRELLAGLIERADPQRVTAAREVAAIARLAERDRGVRRIAQLAAAAGVGIRSLQRLFSTYAGVSPTWMIRRLRLLEAAERVRDGTPVSWAEVAAELGYADQAHLTRDFSTAIGLAPAAYARSIGRVSG